MKLHSYGLSKFSKNVSFGFVTDAMPRNGHWAGSRLSNLFTVHVLNIGNVKNIT